MGIWYNVRRNEFKAEKSKINYNEDDNLIYDLYDKTIYILTTFKAIMSKAH